MFAISFCILTFPLGGFITNMNILLGDIPQKGWEWGDGFSKTKTLKKYMTLNLNSRKLGEGGLKKIPSMG